MLKRRLVDTCGRLRAHLYYRGDATEEELAEVWPADCGCLQKQSPCDTCRGAATKDEWWQVHGHLRYMQGANATRAGTREEADEEALKAAREDPVPVTVWVEQEYGEPKELRLRAHPKGLGALLRFADRDWTVQWLLWRRELLRNAMVEGTLEPETTPQPRELLDRVNREVSHQLALLAYAATRPGPHVEWEELEERLPDDFRAMSTVDYARVQAAWWEANVGRITLLDHVAPRRSKRPGAEGGDEQRVTWSVFGARYAAKMKMTPREFMRDVSLAAALAQMKLSGPGDLEEELEEATG